MELSKLMGCVKRPFIPSELFSGGLIDGAWFDPSDLSTLYQDAAGTTPVTAVEQPVGLMLDKSRGVMLGPELITNGDFSNITTDWILEAGWSVVNNELQYNTGTGRNAYLNIPTVAGKAYLVTYEIKSLTNGGFGIFSIASSNVVAVSNYETTIGKKSAIVIATGTSADIKVRSFTTGTIGVIDNISVREIYGYHATQSITASLPTLSARYNLLVSTGSNLVSEGQWTTFNTSGVLQADGSSLVSRITPTNANANQAVSVPVGVPTTLSAKIKMGTVGNLYGIRVQGSYPNRADAVFNLASGTIAFCAGSAYTNVSATISQPDADGFFSVTLTSTAVNAPIGSVLHGPAVHAGGAWEGAGTLLLNGFIKNPQLVIGTTSGPYQRVNTATDYDTDPRYFQKYLRFDGVDDYLTLDDVFDIGSEGVSIATSVILFDATKSPIAGKSRATSGGGRYFLGTEPGSFLFASHDIEPPANIAYSQSIGESVVLSAKLGPHGARYLSLYKNAALINSRDTALTTSSYDTNNPFWIGAYPNSSGTTPAYGYLNGGIYGLIITKSALTDSQRVACERYLGRKSGVQL